MLLDTYTLWYVLRRGKKIFGKETTKFMQDMVRSKIEFQHEVLAYGILVREEEDYEFLNDVVRSNRFVLLTDLQQRWNALQKSFFHHHTPGLFDASRPHFQKALLSLVAGIIAIGLVGGLYEWVVRRKVRMEKESTLEIILD